MSRVIAVVAAVVVVVSGVAGAAWADVKVTITREESKPRVAEVKLGEDVQFLNASGGSAHVMFGGNGVMFYVGKGASRVRFDKAGTYEYTVHVSGTKAHSHTGSVVVR